MDEPVEADPKGLVREAYRIEGITAAECRSVFLDWALSLPPGVLPHEAIPALLDRYAASVPNHPMNLVLRDGLGATDAPRRRGGRAARVKDMPET
ncbi:MAG TPA: hypothetical protein VLA78_13860 [Paracoccaceae bacterium]|nr:hypothetical protein [Paracoccaceae bacterium]